MTLTMADSITPGNLPGGYDAYLGYVDGSWPTAKALGARFPGKRIVTLTVLGGDAVADGCDRETGDLSAASAVAYTQRRLAAGQWRPVIYASAANMGTVLAVLAAAKISRGSVRLLSAHYGAGEHICGPETCRLVWIPMDGTQWTDSAPGAGGSQIDASVLADDFFGTPAPAQEEHVIIKTAPPGDWEGTVIVTGTGTDGNIWQTKTDNGESWTVPVKEEHVIIKTAPPGDWEGTVIVTGTGTDGNIWQTKTDNGETWTVPVKQ